MSTPSPLPDGRPTSYGYGLFKTVYKGHRVLSHSGHVPGYSAQLARYPDDDLTIAVLTNTDSIAPLQIEMRIADLAARPACACRATVITGATSFELFRWRKNDW